MDIVKTISDWVDEHRQDMLDLLADLIAARTENPPGNESAAADVLEDFLNRRGIASTRHEAAPGRTNLLATIGEGGQSLLMAGHLDVVPAGDGWTRPPFEATFENGLVYGRGVADNKGPTAAVALSGACVKACFDLAGRLIVAGVADEERGSALGLEYLLDENLVNADAAVIPDIAGYMTKIDIAEKGIMAVEIISHGKQAHASRPQEGVNAIWNLIAALHRLGERGLPAARHSLLTPPTHNLGQIAGGAAPNIVPAKASAVLDIRFLPGQSCDDMLDHLQRILDETVEALPGARYEKKLIMTLPPAQTPADNRLVTLIQGAVRDSVGREAKTVGIGGTTVAKSFMLRGVPAVGFGAGSDHVGHMADEYIEVDELVAFAKVMALVAVRFLGVR